MSHPLWTQLKIYNEADVDGLVVENYFGNYYQMKSLLHYLRSEHPDIVYGVNCLNHDALSFYLAKEYNAKFIQLDSVVGHVKPRDESSVEALLQLEREDTDLLAFGGVRFKYQPVLSTNTVEEDLRIAQTRCDAIGVTGDATGQKTSIEKIKKFRRALGAFY